MNVNATNTSNGSALSRETPMTPTGTLRKRSPITGVTLFNRKQIDQGV